MEQATTPLIGQSPETGRQLVNVPPGRPFSTEFDYPAVLAVWPRQLIMTSGNGYLVSELFRY